MLPPDYITNMAIAIRNAKSNALLATIIGIPMEIRVIDTPVRFTEINFLCVHKKLRYDIIQKQ